MNSMRWGTRTVAFTDVDWHQDGFERSILRSRIYAVRRVLDLELMPRDNGQRRCIYLACIGSTVRGKFQFGLLSTHKAAGAARRACERYLAEHPIRAT